MASQQATSIKVVLYVIRKKPPKKRTRDKNHVQKCTREHPRAKHYSSARDARLRAKLCVMTVLRHAHNPTVAFFQISRASRRKRRSCQESRFATIAYPSRGREHEREIPHHRKFNLDAWNAMVFFELRTVHVYNVEDYLIKYCIYPNKIIIV